MWGSLGLAKEMSFFHSQSIQKLFLLLRKPVFQHQVVNTDMIPVFSHLNFLWQSFSILFLLKSGLIEILAKRAPYCP